MFLPGDLQGSPVCGAVEAQNWALPTLNLQFHEAPIPVPQFLLPSSNMPVYGKQVSRATLLAHFHLASRSSRGLQPTPACVHGRRPHGPTPPLPP